MPIAFFTPENERSFSALIDKVVRETGKADLLTSIVGWANQTVRECQALGLYARDLFEDQVATGTTRPFIFTRPLYWRSLQAAEYATSGEKPVFRQVSQSHHEEAYYFYAADDYYVFKGLLDSEPLNIAGYYWAKPLRYFGKVAVSTANYPGGPYTARPAYFDIDTDQWLYLDTDNTNYVTTLGDEDEELLRRQNAMNWVLQDWWDTVKEGTKAKAHHSQGDPRATSAFAQYKHNQELMKRTSGFPVEIGKATS